jgi:hypothetical protein
MVSDLIKKLEDLSKILWLIEFEKGLKELLKELKGVGKK